MRKKEPVDHISTLLGMGTVIEGTLMFKDTIRIDGTVTGNIVSEKGVLIIGERAIVQAEIRVGTAMIKGTVSGRIQAVDRIEINAPARITGDIQAPVISIESGVQFDGRCNMTIPEALPEKQLEKSLPEKKSKPETKPTGLADLKSL